MTGLEQPVQLRALAEQRSLGRVQVLGLALPHHAPAEADHGPLGVADREHDAVAEAVVAARLAVRIALLAFDQQAALDQRRRHVVITIAAEHGLKALPVIRRIAQAEVRGDLAGEAAALQVLDRLRRAAQLAAVEIGGAGHCVGQRHRTGLLLRALPGRQPVALFRHAHADRLGQLAHRFRVGLAGKLHQEADGRAVGATSEAVVELLSRRHRE